MLSESLITKIVNDTLDKEAPRASWDAPNTMALTFGLKLSVPPDLDGHRTLEVVVFRPMNHTQVWSRLLSTTIPLLDLEDEEGEGPRPGKDYTTTTEPARSAKGASLMINGIETPGDLYTIAEFKEMCEAGHLIDYDGIGYFSTETTESGEQVSCKKMREGKGVPSPEYTHVRWYNR